ncbi:hypothetical protein SAMN02800692_1521 [Luteibacter sp. UNC138MFCol5.1]|uniref:hypothetical protein n=1 Tax=Luteibacter sp. UNC138MFCol5.1 TaxID=1502774 RepID=UPI0008AC3493|nr:hypothetical protein [Luteibacter sp. UNC138MFCol5.1]SEO63493.1 hypothetical protein SAMN02800692_1521 [Luteibacter sp. UNC138MFCol5.1]
MNDKVKVRTLRPVLFEGKPQTEFETTELHRRELETRGLLEGSNVAAKRSKPAPRTSGAEFIDRKAAEVIAAIEGADQALLAEALEAEQAKGDKARSTVVDALQAAIDG